MNRKKMIGIAFAAALVSLVSTTHWVYGDDRGNGRPMPPPEAVEACQGKIEGEAVQITSPDGEIIEATCRELGDQLAAVPDKLREPKDRGPGAPPR